MSETEVGNMVEQFGHPPHPYPSPQGGGKVNSLIMNMVPNVLADTAKITIKLQIGVS